MKSQMWGDKLRGLHAVVYSLSILLVISFVLFEVLDIDGSSFSTRFGNPAGWAESPEGGADIRRALSDGTMHLQWYVTSPIDVVDDPPGHLLLRPPNAPQFLWVPNKHTFCRVLPRASISETSEVA